MKRRYLEKALENLCFAHRKIAFVSGPRQCGKTTLGKMLLKDRGVGSYYNWDETEFRRLWTKSPKAVLSSENRGRHKKDVPIIVLDEIHKAKKWKQSLKGVYDTMDRPADIIVTGSARLSVYRKGSDSLMGRYYHFRLHPFTLSEIGGYPLPDPELLRTKILNDAGNGRKQDQTALDSLLKFGGFPEPFLAGEEKRLNLWRRGRIEKVIREDLRDLSRIPELSQIEMLVSLLPERVGSLFSRASLREDLEVSFDTVRRWMQYLYELYYAFEIKPYIRKIPRSLKRDGKLYLWDYSEIADPAARFENLVASHLLKACHYWTDTGEGLFELFYLRTKEKREIDFLIVKDRKPWLPVEVKTGETEPSPHFKRFLPQLDCPVALQLIHKPDHFTRHKIGKTDLLVASAARVLRFFV
ncbi:MAG: ATP-binding protein [Acidobacteria bacterium]|nr:ATP-binding protein [Acidobacteriota bacterium]